MIGALMSTYREGRPALSSVRSALAGCDFVYVVEAGIAGSPETGDPTPLEEIRELGAEVRTPEPFASDAAKRDAMLRWARAHANVLGRGDDPLWVLWLDGDELLVFGEYLPDLAYRVEFETGAGGFPLRIVELDGSVAMTYGKIIRADAVRRYLHSSYQVELVNGLTVALPNVPICAAGGVPVRQDGEPVTIADMAYLRPPLAGEPHLLHRSLLRSPERGAERQSTAESRWFSEILGPDGETLREVPR